MQFQWVVLNKHQTLGFPRGSQANRLCFPGGLHLWPIRMGDLLAAGGRGHFDSGTARPGDSAVGAVGIRN